MTAINSILPIVVIIIFILVFTYVFLMFISPKFRGKMMSKNIKATRYMAENSKDDIQNIQENMLGASIKATDNVIDNNYDSIKNISSKMAEASSDAIETTARAIKKGITEEDKIFCKYCGNKIDSDSKFCNKCGKEQ